LEGKPPDVDAAFGVAAGVVVEVLVAVGDAAA
jgi:hypothetical protein